MLYPGFADRVKTVHVSEANGSVPLVSWTLCFTCELQVEIKQIMCVYMKLSLNMVCDHLPEYSLHR